MKYVFHFIKHSLISSSKHFSCSENTNGVLFYYTVLLLLASAPVPGFSQRVTAVTGVSITVEDLDREVKFFTEILDFQKVRQEQLDGSLAAQLFGLPAQTTPVQIVTLQLGSEQIRLLDFDSAAASGKSISFNRETRSNDLWFQHLAIVVNDMDAAYRRLLQANVAHVSTAPQTLPDYLPNAAGIQAFYFRDPEGHNLELICFPPGKGNPKWQSSNRQALFLGIDHTAIGISDTEKSMAFYRDLLGLVPGGHSENYGTEQEHLNQVFGARLDINGLHADAGVGVEFLRYIAPPGGRPYPAESRPSDLWHYQTEFTVEHLDLLIKKLGKQGFVLVSTEKIIGSGEATVLLRDPDGHAVLLREVFR